MAQVAQAPTPEPVKTEAPVADGHKVVAKKKVKKKKKKTAHSGHKFHKDHKLAEVEPVAAPPPAPPPPVVEPPPPVVVEQPPPPPPVKKEEKFYAGFGLGNFRVDVIGRNINGAGAQLRMAGSEFGGYGNIGWNFNKYLAVEGRIGGVATHVQQFDGAPFVFSPAQIVSSFVADTDGFQSAFLKGTIPIGNRFGIYGLVGGTHGIVKLATDIGALSYREDYNDGDISYGAGVQARVGDTFTLGAEWVRYFDDEDGGVAATLEGAVGRVQFRF